VCGLLLAEFSRNVLFISRGNTQTAITITLGLFVLIVVENMNTQLARLKITKTTRSSGETEK